VIDASLFGSGYYDEGIPSGDYMLNGVHQGPSFLQTSIQQSEGHGISELDAGFQYAMSGIDTVAPGPSHAERLVLLGVMNRINANAIQVAFSILD
jgi:hypothetical protein